MAERNALPSRKVIRLQGYDYSLPGDYFLTICTLEKKCVFGRVDGGSVRLNLLGEMVHSAWLEIPTIQPRVSFDEWIIMPNHIHGIVSLSAERESQGVGADLRVRPRSLSDFVRSFKMLTTARYWTGVRKGVWPDMGGRLWQRGYYEHIIRKRGELNHIRSYIGNNP